ncbi:MAG: prepilin peptidase [Ahniella sp.]|nr:prepilin peptidase [Ahniella sp.]
MSELVWMVNPWVAFVVGLLIGSFLNVVILRTPPLLEWGWRRNAREILEMPEDGAPRPPGLVLARSHCMKCGHGIRWYENMPLVSWLALRGKCSACKTPISFQYPFVELLTGLASAYVVYRFGVSLETVVVLVFTWMLIAASVIDFNTTLLPDEFTLPLMWLGLLCALGGMFVSPQQALLGAAIGYLSLWSIFWLFKLSTGKEGMGYGDFKLLAALGAFVGAKSLLPIVLLSSLFGAVIGGAFLLLKNKDRQTQIPFGPYLAAAGWTQFMFGPEILAWYERTVGMPLMP